MKRHRLLTIGVCGMFVSTVLSAAAKPVITSVKNGETLRYPLVMVGGTYDGTVLQVKTRPAKLPCSVTTHEKEFRMLAELKEGKNTLYIKDSSGTTTPYPPCVLLILRRQTLTPCFPSGEIS